MTSTQAHHFITPGTNNLNHLNPFHPNTRSPPKKSTLWDYITKTNKKHQPQFNPYGIKYKQTFPDTKPVVSPKQLKIHQHHSQVEGINKLPDSDTLNIGFININGLYPAKEDRMLETSQ